MAKYKPQKEEITTQPKGVLRESDTRMIIDRKLRDADWDIEDKNQVSTEEPAKKGIKKKFKMSYPQLDTLTPDHLVGYYIIICKKKL